MMMQGFAISKKPWPFSAVRSTDSQESSGLANQLPKDNVTRTIFARAARMKSLGHVSTKKIKIGSFC